jgi:hypothetical protein
MCCVEVDVSVGFVAALVLARERPWLLRLLKLSFSARSQSGDDGDRHDVVAAVLGQAGKAGSLEPRSLERAGGAGGDRGGPVAGAG